MTGGGNGLHPSSTSDPTLFTAEVRIEGKKILATSRSWIIFDLSLKRDRLEPGNWFLPKMDHDLLPKDSLTPGNRDHRSKYYCPNLLPTTTPSPSLGRRKERNACDFQSRTFTSVLLLSHFKSSGLWTVGDCQRKLDHIRGKDKRKIYSDVTSCLVSTSQLKLI